VSDVLPPKVILSENLSFSRNCKQAFVVVHSLNNKLPLSPGLTQATSRVLCSFHMSPPFVATPTFDWSGFSSWVGPKGAQPTRQTAYYSFLKCLIHRLDVATLIVWGVRCSRICFGLNRGRSVPISRSIGTERPRLCRKNAGGSPCDVCATCGSV
jgi:hypothetical protein